MPRTTLRICARFVSLVAALGAASAAPPRYRLEVLPAPSGCQTFAVLHGLDRDDREVGVMSCDEFVTQRAVMWTGDGISELPGFGGPSSIAFGLNAAGAIVGTAETEEIDAGSDHVSRPFILDGAGLRDLGTLGGRLGAALAINPAGTIVGGCQSGTVDPRLGHEPFRACIWDRADLRDAGDLGGPEATAYGVSGRGWIVGASDTAELLPSGRGPVQHAFLHDGRAMRDLGTLGGPFSLALSLNERGDVVGFSLTGEHLANGIAPWHAFLWHDGTLTDLGTLGGTFSEAWDVDDAGEVVGWSSLLGPKASTLSHAVLWRSGRVLDLNDLLEDPQGCVLNEARAIDGRGRILANAGCSGGSRVVLLTPSR